MSAKQRALLSTADQREGTHNLNSEHNTTCNGATEQSRWSSQARCWVIKGTLDCVFTDWGDLTMRSFHVAGHNMWTRVCCMTYVSQELSSGTLRSNNENRHH